MRKPITWLAAWLLVWLALCPAIGFGAQVPRAVYSKQKITTGGIQRSYGIYIPQSYDPKTPAPLVLNFHASVSYPKAQFVYSGIKALSDKHGLIAVMPAGTYRLRSWNAALDPKGPDDVRFIADLIKELSAKYNIDAKRIYAMGMSGGARMASRLGCQMASTLAAIAVVAGVQFPAGCQPNRPLPIIAFHGKADKINPYALGGKSPAYWTKGVEDSVAGWAKHNGCAAPAGIEKKSPKVSKRSWSKCRGGSEVVFYTISNGGHTWPGSPIIIKAPWAGETNQDIKASELIWRFFQSHPLVH